jgi:hypothetical protein
MLDHFSTDNADDYSPAFRRIRIGLRDRTTCSTATCGMKTISATSAGEKRRRAWMTAGRGIIHSEMPQRDAGRMRGFQLWINLPAAEKRSRRLSRYPGQ